MSVSKKVKSEAMKAGMKAMSKLMESPDRAEKVMKAFQTAQQSKEKANEVTQRLLHLSQLPSRDDVRDLSRQAGRLRRQAKKILASLDRLAEHDDEA
jgi:hypothetical protein